MTIGRLIYLILVFGLVLTSTSLAKASKKQQSDIRFRPGNRNKIHDISIIQIRVEPTQFKIGNHVRVLVSVANRGKASVNDVSLELKIRDMPIGHRNITTIAPGQIVEVGFTCIIGRRKSELIEIAATIKPIEIEKIPREKIKKVRYNCAYNAEDDVVILYKVEPPVHQWIAFQAYNKLPTGTLKSEISAYLPTSSSSWYYSSSFDPVTAGWTDDPDAPYNDLRALIEGTWEEDKPDWLLRWKNHYWNPDGGYDDGLYIGFKSALQKGQEDLWQQAISAYGAGNKTLAYYRVGRIAHLLMDMSVPAHTLMDVHFPDDDQYEEFTKDNYKNITSSSSNTGIPSGLPSYPQYTPPSYNDSLTKLFYNLAEKSDDFDSDDEEGESINYGKGKYTYARNALDSSKTFSYAEYWGVISKIRTLTRYVDYDIFQGCSGVSEYSIYYYKSFYDEINNTLNRVKVFYTDGSNESFWNLDEFFDVPDSVLECIHQKELQAKAIGYVAALYQLLWDETHMVCPPPPTLISPPNGSNVSGSEIEFQWNASSGANNYHFQLATDVDFNNKLIDQDVGNTTSIIGTGFPDEGTKYYWRVKAGNAAGWSAYTPTWDFINGEISIPDPPEMTLPSNGSNAPGTTVEFRWNASAGADNYYLQVATDSGFNNTIFDDEIGNYVGVDMSGLPDDGTQFYWHVKAGNALGWSNYSETWSFVNGYPTVAITASDPEAAEPADNGYFTVSRSGSTSATLRVYYGTSGSTATAGSDYAQLPGYVDIPAGQVSALISVVVIDDSEVESSETVKVTLSPHSSYEIDPSHNNATVTIADNDVAKPIVSVEASDPNAAEPADNGYFTVSRSGSTSATLRVYYGTSGSTATAGSDYAQLPSYVDIPAGQTSALISVVVIDDSEVEGSETVKVTLSPHSSYDIDPLGGSATVTIADDDIPTEPEEFFEDFETGDFSRHPWLQPCDANWVITSGVVHEGTYAAQSGAISDDQESCIELTKNVPTGYITFWRKVSSEEEYDWLTFYIDDCLAGLWSGERDWAKKSYFIEEGTHTFKWAYEKDVSLSSGSDCGWIDDILFEAEPIDCALYCWADFHANCTLTSCMTVTPTSYFAYDWYYEDHWVIYGSGGGFTATFDCPADGQFELVVRHLSSASGACPGGGYSPVTIKLNGDNIVSCYDPAENHGGTHGFVTDTWLISCTAGTNTLEWIACELCTNYWIQGIEIRYPKNPEGDINCDSVVDFYDFAIFADYLAKDCSTPNWCGGRDIDKSGSINFVDLRKLTEHWLELAAP